MGFQSSFRHINHTRGASLIEVMMFVGLMSVMGLGITTMAVNGQKDMGRLRNKQQLAAFATQVQSSLFYAKTCVATLPLNLPYTSQMATAAGQTIAIRQSDGTTLSAGSSPKGYPDLKIDRVYLHNATVPAGTGVNNTNGNKIFTVQMALQATSKKDNFSYGVRELGQFTIEVNASNAIVNCFVLNSTDTNAAADYCATLGGTFANGKCSVFTPAEVCQKLGGTWTGKCEIFTKAELCAKVDGSFNGAKCTTSPMPQRCSIQTTSGSGTKCCSGGDEVIFSAFAPGDNDYRRGFASARCINVSNVGGAVQLLCCK